VFAIDAYGDLTPAATSSPVGVSAFSGVAFRHQAAAKLAPASDCRCNAAPGKLARLARLRV
jgi:hypothetical protein